MSNFLKNKRKRNKIEKSCRRWRRLQREKGEYSKKWIKRDLRAKFNFISRCAPSKLDRSMLLIYVKTFFISGSGETERELRNEGKIMTPTWWQRHRKRKIIFRMKDDEWLQIKFRRRCRCRRFFFLSFVSQVRLSATKMLLKEDH